MKPLVSIIMPVYNAEKYLKESLKGILSSTYTDFELIIVNDGSTDNSKNIINRFSSEDNRIRSFSKTNGGPSDARNYGIQLAKGKYICFVDADDIPLPNMLETLVDSIGDADICIGKKIRWNQIKDFKREDGWQAFEGGMNEFRKVHLRYQRSMRGTTARLYRKDIIIKHNLIFDTGRNYAEDMYFNYAYFRFVEKIVFAPDPVYIYRIHEGDCLSRCNAPFFLRQWQMEIGCKRRLFKGKS